MRKIRASLAVCAIAITAAAALPGAAGAINNGNLVVIGTTAAPAEEEGFRVNNGNLIQLAPTGSSGGKTALVLPLPGSLQGWWWLLSLLADAPGH